MPLRSAAVPPFADSLAAAGALTPLDLGASRLPPFFAGGVVAGTGGVAGLTASLFVGTGAASVFFTIADGLGVVAAGGGVVLTSGTTGAVGTDGCRENG